MLETTKGQLLASAIAGLAAISGAFGGGWLVSQNAMSINRAQLETAQRTTLRTNRQAAYTEFIAAAQAEDADLTTMAVALDQADAATVEQVRRRLLDETNRLTRGHLGVWLIGSPEVVALADRLLAK